jgi:hypothetical protein
MSLALNKVSLETGPEEGVIIKSPVPCVGTLNNALLCFVQMIV